MKVYREHLIKAFEVAKAEKAKEFPQMDWGKVYNVLSDCVSANALNVYEPNYRAMFTLNDIVRAFIESRPDVTEFEWVVDELAGIYGWELQ